MVAVKCPKCRSDNSDTARFCSNCATSLTPGEGPLASVTRTIETGADHFARGAILAGRYEIIEELGAGGMGRVFRAFDRKIEEEVAVKIIRPEVAVEKRTVERFKSEIKIARKITHANICRTHDLGGEGKVLFITMEYVRGENLKDAIRRMGPLTAGKAVSIAAQIARGLTEAHKLGIVHRDLKPGNIIIDQDGNAKIMDFGIARYLTGAGTTAEGAFIGTPEYMSPEQVEGKPADPRADIYALGVILFEMVTGRPLFEGETPLAVAHKHKYEPAPDPRTFDPQLPADLSRVILRCLEKGTENRYPSAGALLSELERITEALPVPEGLPSRRKPTASREITVKFTPKKLILPVVLFIALAAGAAFLWKLSGRKGVKAAARIDNSIAVVSFENLTGDSQNDSLVKAIPSLFITKFEAMGFSYVATWERLQDILKQLGKDPDKPIDTETGFLICRREGIAALVVGKVTKAGNIFATDIKVLDAGTKRSLASATSHGEGEDSILLSQIDELSGRIARELGGSLLSAGPAPAIAEITTSSMEAYKEYQEGEAALSNELFAEARGHFIKAIAIDPALVMARLGMARTFFSEGNSQASREALEQAVPYAGRANPKEKLFFQAWHARIVEGDMDKHIRIMKDIAEKYPKEKLPHLRIGTYYRYSDPDEAIREYQEAIDLDPSNLLISGELGLQYAKKGDYGKALESANRYAASAPGIAVPYAQYLAEIYLRMGRPDPAIEACQKALSLDPSYNYALGYVVCAYAMKEDYLEALKWADEKISRSANPVDKVDGFILKCFLEFWTGRYRRSREHAGEARSSGGPSQVDIAYWLLLVEGFGYLDQREFERARDSFIQSGDVEVNKVYSIAANERVLQINRELLAGLAEIRLGRFGEARSRMKVADAALSEFQGQKARRDYVEHFLALLRGEAALAEGRAGEAISLLAQLPSFNILGATLAITQGDNLAAINLCLPRLALARSYEMNGETDKAIDVLEKLVRPDATREFLQLTPPRAYYELGTLYENKGLKKKAVDAFTRFLELWKDADLGLPEVPDAKARLARLQGN